MYKITIKGKAQSDFYDLAQLDGIDCHDEFCEYMDTNDCSASDELSEGYLKFEYDEEKKKLISVNTYESTRELTKEELHDLGEYTQGQWSDGIGEGFEQNPCIEIDGEEVFISPWYGGQKLTITQTLE
tara:strand:+ start:21984 stop:22367 length:384 start_codon:yes stop_codon:yes gene_type:complete